ncbi:MAG: hypothetical protein AB1589_44125, partial [Cyanobacteriota bacterium]
KLANKAPRDAGGHSINMNDPEVYATFMYAKNLGLITQAEVDQVMLLAQYNKPLFPDVTLFDVISHFDPQLIDGAWHEIAPTDGRVFTLNLNARTQEVTHVVVQMQDLSGEWEHATALHGIQSAKPYRCELPYYGQARAIRWSCAYALNGAVAVV